ncbi:hypothetical protein Ahy_B09g097207 isoform B [Arachis hypogaea]|uniref:SWIM-type domain-containing protein n=1 Tax=Arachis hypogaea TaxID=3818 RepID=A0A444XNP8_ARAHY|nr:hypothetical protein Ahy_B09g097207 isoform B [Arachis hypogaea]
MSSQWLSKAFMKKICENPKIKLRSLIKKAHSKWNVDLTMTKAARVKQQALDEINGTYGEQYRRIHDYAAELLRPMIGLDGCFIKTPYGGQLLTAIGWDPNDQILPIAYAVVEAETKDSWRWFLLNLCDDLVVDKIRWWSDNRQSIVTYAGEILPKINKKIEREFDKGGEWLAIYAGRDKYEVSSSQGNRAKFVVDLNLHECSCRKFQLTGYPCEHAMSCIRKMCLDVKNYTENDDVLPPVFRKPIGRPKLRRNKTGDEPRNNGPLSKLARTGQQQKCSYCFALGHNKRTCPRKRKMEAAAKKAKKGAKKGAGTTRTPKPNKIPAKTTTQPATRLQPKRKSSTQVGGSQESQTSSKRARCSSSASQPQPSIATVTSPSRRSLRFMAKTPPRAWKALG